MQQRFAARSGRQAAVYRIVVRGEIVRPLVGPLEDMSVELRGGECVLTGELVDQAQLRGALGFLHDLGVEIVSVNPADEPGRLGARSWACRRFRLPAIRTPSRGRPSAGSCGRRRRPRSRYTAHRNPQIAAAISYHVLFAIVPLFVFLGTIFGLLLRDDQRRQDVTDQLVDRFPLSPDAGVDIERLLAEIPTPFSVIGVLSILALLWSASGMMSSVRVGLTSAFDEGEGRPFFRSKLVDFLLILAVALLFIGFLALSIAINAIERWSETVAGGLGAAGLGRGSILALLGPPLLTFGLLLLLYRLVPRKKLRFRDLAAGALVAAVASEAIRVGFSYYLTSVARYDLLYGALGSVFALLLVVYLQALVLLLGAEIAYAWAQSAYGPPEPPVPVFKQVRDAVSGLFVRRP